MGSQNHRIAFFAPWDEIPSEERQRALETAAEIIFADKSAVLRNNDGGWKPDYRRMRSFDGEAEADTFIFMQHAAGGRFQDQW